MIYVLYDESTGNALSTGSIAPVTVLQGRAVYTLDVPYAHLSQYLWNAGTLVLELQGPPVRYVMSAGDFMRRVGLEREIVLNMLELDPSTPLQTRATLKTLNAWIQRVTQTGVDVRDPVSATGATIIGSLLHAAGTIPEGVPAFVEMLLTPLVGAPLPTEEAP